MCLLILHRALNTNLRGRGQFSHHYCSISKDMTLDQELCSGSLRLHKKSEKEVKSVCHWFHIHSIKRCILGQGYRTESNLRLELHPTEAAFCRKPSSTVSGEPNAVLQLESRYKWTYKNRFGRGKWTARNKDRAATRVLASNPRDVDSVLSSAFSFHSDLSKLHLSS